MTTRLNRRQFLTAASSLTAAALLSRYTFAQSPGLATAPKRPNIVFILTDDQGYGDLSCHGHPFLKTPNLDKLRSQSVSLTDFQVSPICSPTRCALMTGRHEYRSGVTQTRGPCQNMSLTATTIAEVLKSAGYATGQFGKWHLGDQEPYQPHQRGFDECHNFLAGMLAEGDRANAGGVDPFLRHNGVREKNTGFCTDVFFDLAMKWMDGVRNQGPFFAYIATSAPHFPPHCPDSYAKPYAAQGPTMAQYFGMIANIDDNVGRLLAQLQAWGIERDTLLIFMSDNGATSKSGPNMRNETPPAKVYNAGMKGAKSSVHEGGTRVPSFWRWPAAFNGGREIDQLAAAIDVFPTLTEIAGAKLPPNLKLDGRSLMPLLKDPRANWPDRFIFIHESNYNGKAANQKINGAAIRSNQYRLIAGHQLFDIKADRGETNDVSAQHPEMVANMRAAYDKWWQEVLPAMQENERNAPGKAAEGNGDD